MRERLTRLLVALVLITAFAAACGDDDDDGGDDAATDDTAAEEPAEEPAEAIEATPVVATLDQNQGPEPPFEVGSVEAHWYNGGETWAVVYTGLDLEATGPLCPGNSIDAGGGNFQNVSNTPTEEGACEGSGTPEASLQVCGSTIVYSTLIPTDATGTLYGTINGYEGGELTIAVTSTVEADAASAPELDPAAAGYDFPEELGGPVTCA